MSITNPLSTPHPNTVGNSFVKQYYHLLAQNPKVLHRFYKDESSYMHGQDVQPEESISGQQQINDKIIAMNFAGARVDLESGSVDCQPSLNGGVLVMVIGIITLQGQNPRSFAQTFFLAVQPSGFFVLNDCFRYLAPIPTSPVLTPTPVLTTTTGTVMNPLSPTLHHTSSSLPLPSPSPLPLVSVDTGTSMDQSTPLVNVETPLTDVKKHKETKKEMTQNTSITAPDATLQESPPEAPVQKGPKSWASLFAGSKSATTSLPASASASASASTSSSVKGTKKNSIKSNDWNDDTSDQSARVKKSAHVLYLRDLPSQTKDSDLRALFQNFGTITAINIVANRGYGFVDFDHPDAVKEALSPARLPYTVLNKTISVEERHADRRDGQGRGYSSYRGARGGHEGRGGGRHANSNPSGRGRGDKTSRSGRGGSQV